MPALVAESAASCEEGPRASWARPGPLGGRQLLDPTTSETLQPMATNPELQHHPAGKPLRLRNETCVYCGVEFGPGQKRTKEHVIGRDFVPEVDFSVQWNLIVNACEGCNTEKSDLEGELAALTMQPDVLGRFAHDDERLARESVRKGRGAISARTGKPVIESQERFTIKGELMPGVTVSFGFVGPAQSVRDRVLRLAELHLRAFFYLITYDRQTRRGGGPSGAFLPLSIASKQDWGNAVLQAFQNQIKDWPFRVHALAADGYFKLIIRRRENSELWAWALEWNRNLRLAGFLGDESAVREVVARLPPLRDPKAYRKEVPLPEDDDILFDGPEPAVPLE